MIYFIGNKQERKVKIGYSMDRYMRGRFLSVQTNCPFDVEVFVTINGMKDTEKYFHNLFVKDHIRGEWFNMSDEIQEFINNPYSPNIKETFRPLLVPISGDTHKDIEELYSQNMDIIKIARQLGHTYSQVRTHITRRKLHLKYQHTRKIHKSKGTKKKHIIPDPI